MDRGAWWATVHGVTKSWTQLSMHTRTHAHTHTHTRTHTHTHAHTHTHRLKELFLINNNGQQLISIALSSLWPSSSKYDGVTKC